MLDNKTGVINLSDSDNNCMARGGIMVGGAANGMGLENGATAFDGVDDYIDCGTSLNLGSGDFSMSVWLNRYNYVQYQEIASKGIYNSAGEWYLYNYSSNTNWNFYGNGGRRLEWTMDECFNKWAHLILIRKDDQMSVYVNGKQKTITADSVSGTNSNFTNDKVLSIGALAPSGSVSRVWNGELADFRIYHRALSEEEIRIMYETTK